MCPTVSRTRANSTDSCHSQKKQNPREITKDPPAHAERLAKGIQHYPVPCDICLPHQQDNEGKSTPSLRFCKLQNKAIEHYVFH
jgi:hypothetical protein